MMKCPSCSKSKESYEVGKIYYNYRSEVSIQKIYNINTNNDVPYVPYFYVLL